MTSADLDSYLILQNNAGQKLAHDDDSGGNLNARIVFRCPVSGPYRIIATELGGGPRRPTGHFAISIQER